MAFTTKLNLINAKFYQSDGGLLTLSGDTRLAGVSTLQYLTDQSSTFVARSVPDAAYVTGNTATVLGNYYTKTQINSYTAQTDTRLDTIEFDYVTGATNGLSKTGAHDVKLGGTLSETTTINGAQTLRMNVCTISMTGTTAFNLSTGNGVITDTGTNGGLKYAAAYDANVVALSIPNAAWVTGKTATALGNYYTKTQINSYTAQTDTRLDTIEFDYVTGATNGIGKTGSHDVCLGGALIANTSITADFDLCLGTSGSRLNTLQSFVNEDVILNATCSILMTASGASFCDIAGTPKGIQYVADYSLNYVPRSLVDKGYVDSVATGLNVHTAVRVATTSGITIATAPAAIDGITLVNGDRVLVKNQGIGFTGHTDNGIYIFNGTGSALTRATDYDGSPASEVTNGDLIPVTTGSTQNNTLWALTTQNPITVGVTPLVFSEFGTTIDVIGGQGICITQVGGVHTVCVNATSGCGLAVGVGGLCIDNNIDGSGLTYSGGVLKVNAATGGAASSISVKINAGNCLVVNCTDISTAVGAITTANNGLNKAGTNVRLGGPLTGATTINGGQTLSINQATLNLSGNTSVKITGATVCIGGSTAVKLTSTPATGSISDSLLVRAADGTIKTVSSIANNIYSHTTLTTSDLLTTGSSYVILVNSPGAGVTVSLPVTPIDGQAFKIKDVGGAALTFNIIIDGNGNNIDGAACGLINTSYGALELMYETTLDGWFSLAFIN